MTIELLDVVIKSRDDQGLGVAIFELTSSSSQPLPSFVAGAHIDVHIDSETVRQYSLCNNPSDTSTYRIGVLNDPNSRGGSVKIHQDFTEGKALKVSSPRNHFPLEDSAKRTILAGGGIGITPMIAMAYELQNQGKDFEIHYCTRTKGAGAFTDELEQSFPGKISFHYDDAGKEQLFSPERDFSPYDKDTHIYVCGPSGFMDWVIDSAKAMSYPAGQIHFEYFSAEVDTSGAAFEVYCKKSDITVTVNEEQNIVKALAEVGVKVDVSCEEGVCGTCITDVLEGEPDHRDHFLTEEEREDNDQIALCCSRSKSQRLVIDI
jgi:vanillate O-demethylase ferredoxin subunit